MRFSEHVQVGSLGLGEILQDKIENFVRYPTALRTPKNADFKRYLWLCNPCSFSCIGMSLGCLTFTEANILNHQDDIKISN